LAFHIQCHGHDTFAAFANFGSRGSSEAPLPFAAAHKRMAYEHASLNLGEMQAVRVNALLYLLGRVILFSDRLCP